MVGSTGGIQQIVDAIRVEIAARPATPLAQAAVISKTVAGAMPTRARGPGWRESIRRRIWTISPDDPERGRKALRVFLESVLLDGLGPNLINDPGFYELVERVQATIESDPGLRGAVDRAVQELVKAKGR